MRIVIEECEEEDLIKCLAGAADHAWRWLRVYKSLDQLYGTPCTIYGTDGQVLGLCTIEREG